MLPLLMSQQATSLLRHPKNLSSSQPYITDCTENWCSNWLKVLLVFRLPCKAKVTVQSWWCKWIWVLYLEDKLQINRCLTHFIAWKKCSCNSRPIFRHLCRHTVCFVSSAAACVATLLRVFGECYCLLTEAFTRGCKFIYCKTNSPNLMLHISLMSRVVFIRDLWTLLIMFLLLPVCSFPMTETKPLLPGSL